MADRPQVLIVGAGPTGLTAAIELARRGLRPHLVERDQEPTALSKAVGISANSLDLLEPSGATARLLDQGLRIRRLHVWSGERLLAGIDFGTLPHRFNFLLSLPQSQTETILADVLGGYGVEVAWGTTLTGLRPARDGVEVAFDGAAPDLPRRFDLVFGADGAHSTVRRAAGLGFEGRTHPRVWSIADAEISGWPHPQDAGQLFLHRGGDVGFIIPIGRDRFRAVSNTPDALARIPGGYRVTSVLRTDTFQIPVRQAPGYRAGSVFLGGDAAHVHSPVGARGMNLGIEDAACFARRVAADELDGYSAERHPVGARWIRFSERLLARAQAAGPLAAGLRDLGIRAVGRLPAVQRRIAGRVAGLRK